MSGRKFDVEAKVSRRHQVQRIDLNRHTDDSWQRVASVTGDGSKTYDITSQATGIGDQSYRLAVTYRNGQQASSAPFTVTVYKWMPLRKVPSTHREPNVDPNGSFTVGETPETGWMLTGGSEYGYEDFATQGQCWGIQAIVASADTSEPRSGAQIRFLPEADEESDAAYYSPALRPGDMAMAFVVLDWAQSVRVVGVNVYGAPNGGKDAPVAVPVIPYLKVLCSTEF